MNSKRIHMQQRLGLKPLIVPPSRLWTGLFAFLLGFALSLSAQAVTVRPIFRCAKIHTAPQGLSMVLEDWGVQVEHVQVTGSQDYPLQEVLRALGINSKWLENQRKSQKQVVSLAEGTSDLMPYLIHQNINAFGSDLWYFSPELQSSKAPSEMKSFVARWSTRLFASDATDLSLASESVGVILSHKLINNLHIADSMKILTEVIRVLEVHGEARISDVSAHAFRALGPFLEKNYRNVISFQHSGDLLILRKEKSNQGQLAPRIPYDRNLRYLDVPNGTRTFELPFAPGHQPG